ncbi:MAG: phytanoyl-CoA dioxygenase [Pirellula sp.]|nr:phytanoyl-CoA dioxygenase [Pirellula sp.]
MTATMQADAQTLQRRIAQDGWAVTPAVVEDGLLNEIIAETNTERAGLRDLLSVSPATRRLTRHPAVRQIAEATLGPDCFVTRAILFDKTDGANWKVAWHQDLTIAVAERIDAPGYGPWSLKTGIVHVQPPCDVLERMLAVRVHLDDCTNDNGPVRVLTGSHQFGKIPITEIPAWKDRNAPVECLVSRGGVLAFRPLLLHASSQAERPQHRRVVHFEFAVGDLPGGLQWHCRA